ncbi:PREDICTED: cysteine-rich repeat secretory protein 12-like, partial [Brassica oleracea var. oleracea]|uniref:cysteine-rich repeat secretory protein 12-like n=1 Tax=Brassica oleracea var. oleracea TaxID=109376 RepID=UPI0006A756C7
MSSTKTIISISVVIAAVYLLKIFAFPAVEPLVYYHYCSPAKYFHGPSSKSNIDSLLNLFVNSASIYTYNNLTVNGVYGLYQCRGDVSSSDCVSCIAQAVRLLQSDSLGESGCALQLEGCLVKYDSVMFLGMADKMAMVMSCGKPAGYRYKSDELTQAKVLVDVVTSCGTSYRLERSGQAQAVAQCTGDLSATDCQNCLIEAIQRLKLQPFCGTSTWGDVYLAKCYVGYSSRGAIGQEFKKGIRAKHVATQRNSLYLKATSLFYLIKSLLK